MSTSLIDHQHRRNYLSFKKLQELAQRELKGFPRPFVADPKRVSPQTQKRLIDTLVSFYKLHNKAFKNEILDNRISLLKKKQVGEYII